MEITEEVFSSRQRNDSKFIGNLIDFLLTESRTHAHSAYMIDAFRFLSGEASENTMLTRWGPGPR